MDLSLTTRVEGGYTVVEADGEIDIYTAPALREQVATLVNAGAHHLILDLEKVTFFDSTGLGVLIGARQRLHAHDGSLSLVCTRENIAKIFRITGLAEVFPFHPDVAAATGSVPERGRGTKAVSASREQVVTQVFVSISQALVEGHDVMDLHTGLVADCARVLDVACAGLLLADRAGALHLMAASTPRTEHLELYQLQLAEGPCLDCYRTGAPVLVADLSLEYRRWPGFAPVAVEAGFVSVHAVPMRLGETVLGALGLFGADTGTLNADDLALAQAFAHVASVALMAGRVAADKAVLAEQLQTALDSRGVLEQAKGILAQDGNLDMDQAFAVLRRYCRDHSQRLTATAAAVVSRDLPVAVLLAHARAEDAARPTAANAQRMGGGRGSG